MQHISSPEHVERIGADIANILARYGFQPLGVSLADGNDTVRIAVAESSGQVLHLTLQAVCPHLAMPVAPETPDGRCAMCAAAIAG